MKLTVNSFILFFIIAHFGSLAQTNVTANITSNTVWSLAGSPYIVTGTITVNQGVTLKIDPAVTVKFNAGAQLVIQSNYQNKIFAQIVAHGNSVDSIRFISNAGSPAIGDWQGVKMVLGNDSALNFNYCVFKHAATAIINQEGVLDILKIKNSSFYYNAKGIHASRAMEVDSCVFKYNVSAFYNAGYSTLRNCRFSSNAIGVDAPPCTSSQSSCGNPVFLYHCAISSNTLGISQLNETSLLFSCKINKNQVGIQIPNFIRFGSINIRASSIDSNSTAGLILYNGIVNVDSCEFIGNSTAIVNHGGGEQSSFTRNTITQNTIGIRLLTNGDVFYCNKICNNSGYNVKYLKSGNISLADNYWCTTNTTSLQTSIFDGNDSSAVGMISLNPLDNVSCYACPIIALTYTTNRSGHTIANGSASITANLGVGPYTYSWSSSVSHTTQTVSGLAPGSYTVKVTDALGCWSRSVITISDSLVLSINGESLDQVLNLFPNPATEIITMELLGQTPPFQIRIFNGLGNVQYSNEVQEQKSTIDISSLSKGLYIIQVSYGNSYIRRKFIRN